MKAQLKTKQRQLPQSGFTLFELLIAVLVLAVGLLGLATMQTQGLKSNSSAEKRTEATFLAMDIMDRMRTTMTPNPINGQPPVVDPAFNNVDAHSGAMYACSGTCSVVQQDLNDWVTAASASLGGGGNTWRAQVSPVVGGGGVYMITLMWDDERRGATGTNCTGATTQMTCFQTLFLP